MLDETGVIAPGKLLFSDNAWEDLLGRDAEDLLKLGQSTIALFECLLMMTPRVRRNQVSV